MRFLKKLTHLCTFVALLATAFSVSAQNSDGLIRQYLESNMAKYQLWPGDVEYKVSDEYFTKANGITHVYLNQTYQGVPIFNAVSSVAIKDGQVASFANRFLNKLSSRANEPTPMLSPEDAVMAAAAHLQLQPVGLARAPLFGKEDPNKITFNKGGISYDDITVEKVYQLLPDGALRLAWNVNIHVLGGSDWWNVRIDATNGAFLQQNNWSVTCDGGHGLACGHQHETAEGVSKNNALHSSLFSLHTEDSPKGTMAGNYRVLPIPVESPNHGSRALLSNPDDPASSPFGWHDTDGAAGPEFTDTRGNNVFAQEDADADNAGGARPSGGPTLTFDFPANFGVDPPAAYLDASTTNLFYMNNIIHDVLYHYGFDEAGGNFQVNNYGNGGIGNDQVFADAQDGSGMNNANFGTPPDGNSPRMQMFIWNYGVPNTDSDMDNGVIAHEYGHGVSNRLTGGPANTGCLGNQEQMGEGWSDYMSLMFSIEAGDTGADYRGIATYLTNQPLNGNGLRSYPYSTNMAVNPHTYDDIKTEGVPHGVGSVWCAMLWDMTWALIDAEGFDPDFYTGTGGNNVAMHLVMEGMRLQPCNPGFVDGRDAILLADVLLYGGAHKCLIWEAFARRGLGWSAVQGSSNDRGDGTEAFDVDPNCLIPVLPPTADFSLSPNPSCSLPITFTDESFNIAQSWLWDFGDGTTSTLENPPPHTYANPGTYTVTLTVTNVLGTDTHTMTVTNYPGITAGFANGPVFCGQNNINSSVVGGVAPFNYLWSTGATTPNITALTNGEYILTVTDQNSCVSTISTTVNVPVFAAISSDMPAPHCGDVNPVLTATGSGGTSFSGYSVSTIPNNFLACGANAGPTGDDAVNGPHPIGFIFYYYGQPYTNFGLSTNGNVQLGNPPYSNNWANAAFPNGSFGPAIALAWDDMLSDPGDITYHTIGTSPNRIAVICFNNLSHYGGNGGDIVQGQVQLYESTNAIELHLTSSNGGFSSATQAFQLNGGLGTTIRDGAWTPTDARRIEPLPNYRYLWSTGATTSRITAVADGTHTVTITDDLGCTATASYDVDFSCCTAEINGGPTFCGPVSMTASANVGADVRYSQRFLSQQNSPAQCDTWNAFCSQLTGTYGQMRIFSDLNPGLTLGDPTTVQNIANALRTGTAGSWTFGGNTYNVSVGCGAAGSIELHINQAACQCSNGIALRPCIGNFNWGGVNGVNCNAADQTITVEFGASAPINYLWSNGATTQTISPNVAGTYSVTATTNACTATATQTIVINPPFAAALNGGPDFCGPGSLTVAPIGGTPPFTYLWNDGSTTSSLAVDVTGTYNVTVTDGLGCTSTLTSNITVSPEVNASITGGTQFCTSGVLTASVPGGGVPNGARYYIRDGNPWNQPVNETAMDAVFGAGNWSSATYAVNAATIFVPSTQFVFIEGSDGNANAMNTFVTANIALIESWVNAGGRLFMNAAPNQGGDMNWGFGGVTLNYNNAQPTVAASAPGHPIYLGPFLPVSTSYSGNSFSHAHITGGGTTSLMEGSGYVVLSSLNWGAGKVFFGGMTTPNFHQPAPQAQNFRQNVIDNIANGGNGMTYTYLWSTGATTQSITVNVSGTYTVTVTNVAGCTSVVTTTITVGIPAPVITQNGGTLTTGAYNAYQWFYNGNIIIGATNQTYSPTQNGNYTVLVTDANGCTAVAAPFPVIFVGTGQLQQGNIRLYPNPATHIAIVEGLLPNSQLTLFDALGQSVWVGEASSSTLHIPLDGLASGMYYVRVMQGDAMTVLRLEKE